MSTLVKKQGFALLDLIVTVVSGSVVGFLVCAMLTTIPLETNVGLGILVAFIVMLMVAGIMTAAPKTGVDWALYLVSMFAAGAYIFGYIDIAAYQHSFYELYLSNIF